MLYGPNQDSPGFFEIISKHIEMLGNDYVVARGAFNVPLDYSRETKLSEIKKIQKPRESVLQMILEHDHVDVLR